MGSGKGMIKHNMPVDEYFASEGLSQSLMKQLLRSPAHYKAALSSVKSSTAEMELGTALHTLVLEGKEVFGLRYHVLDSGYDGRKKDSKAEASTAKANGFLTIKMDDYAHVLGMAQSINRHTIASGLVTGGMAEVSIFDDIDGVHCKARIDYVHADGLLVDIKTVEDARPEAFKRSVFNYGYHIQAAFYREMYRMNYDTASNEFLFLVVERNPPYGVMVYKLSEDAAIAGMSAVVRAIAVYKKNFIDGIEGGLTRAYEEEVFEIDLPAWYKYGEI
jgi:hypothetical protein